MSAPLPDGPWPDVSAPGWRYPLGAGRPLTDAEVIVLAAVLAASAQVLPPRDALMLCAGFALALTVGRALVGRLERELSREELARVRRGVSRGGAR